MLGQAKTGLIPKVLFRGMDKPNLSSQIPFLDNPQSKHQALTILLTFLSTVHFLQSRPRADLRKLRPIEPYHALLYGVDHPIPPEFYIRLGESDELKTKEGFIRLLSSKARPQEEAEQSQDIEWMRKEVMGLHVQYQIAFADRLDALKLGVELEYLREMCDGGMSVIARDKTREGIARSTGFKSYEEFATAVETAQEAGNEWSGMLDEGLSTVYTNGVSVLYGWTHMRRKRKCVMPLRLTPEMTVRSQLALRMMIPKSYNTRVAALQMLIRALRLTIGSSLIEHIEPTAIGTEEVNEYIHLLKVCASYDPMARGGPPKGISGSNRNDTHQNTPVARTRGSRVCDYGRGSIQTSHTRRRSTV
jgi:hypothetical protein